MAMDLREAVIEVLGLRPSEFGQQNYLRLHLAQLYFTGSPVPSRSPRLHPRVALLREFADTRSREEVEQPTQDVLSHMKVVTAAFEGFQSFSAVDDLCFGWTRGIIQRVVHPSFYEQYFAPEATSENKIVGLKYFSSNHHGTHGVGFGQGHFSDSSKDGKGILRKSLRIARVMSIKDYKPFDRATIPQRNAYAPTQPERIAYGPRR